MEFRLNKHGDDTPIPLRSGRNKKKKYVYTKISLQIINGGGRKLARFSSIICMWNLKKSNGGYQGLGGGDKTDAV